MALEIALLQKFGLFLGHPNYALSVVLAALLLATGVGSLWSARHRADAGRPLRFVSYALAAVVLVEHLALLPRLRGLLGLPFPARVLVAVLLVAPVGCLLGVFVPTALDRLKPEAPALRPLGLGDQRHVLRAGPAAERGGVDDLGHLGPAAGRDTRLPAGGLGVTPAARRVTPAPTPP